MKNKIIFVQAILCLLLPATLNAEENLWLYTQGTDTRPQGSFELKLSNISRIDKDSGDYTFHDIRPEIEYGITDKLTVGFEFMVFNHDYSVDDPDLEPMFGTQGGAGSTFNSTQFGGYELTFKYNILSPYKDPIGLSLGFSYENRSRYRLDGAEIDQDSYVPTLYLTKNWLDDTLTLSFKGKMELEYRTSPGVIEEEIAFDLATGVAYRFKPKWFAGFEFRYQSDFIEPIEEGEPLPEDPSNFTDLGDLRIGLQYQYGLYAGPTIHYAEEKWWVTAGILFQIYGGGDESNPSVDGNRVWDEHEKYHLGIILGLNF